MQLWNKVRQTEFSGVKAAVGSAVRGAHLDERVTNDGPVIN